MKRPLILAILGGGVALAGVAVAQRVQDGAPAVTGGAGMMAGPMARGGMMRLPATREEALEQARTRFAALDSDHDGYVTQDELNQRVKDFKQGKPAIAWRDGAPGGTMMRGGMLMRMDADHDGRVSLEEVQNGALARFDAADSDHDGKLSDQEQLSHARSMMRDRAQRSD